MPIKLSAFRTVFVFLTLLVVSLLLLPYLKVILLTTKASTSLTISFNLPDSGPEVIEEQVTTIIEGACSQLGRLKKISSQSSNASGSVELEFSEGTDLALKRLEVASIIREVYRNFPYKTSYPKIINSAANEANGDTPVLIYTIDAPFTLKEIKKNVEAAFTKGFNEVPAFKQAVITGSENTQIVIQYDKSRLNALKIDAADIAENLRLYTGEVYIGQLNTATQLQYFVHTATVNGSLSHIENIVLPVSKEKRVVRLRDVAKVYFQIEEPHDFFRVNGKNAITLNIYEKNNSNKILLSKLIKESVKKNTVNLPKGYRVELAYDDADFFNKELSKTYRHLLITLGILIFFVCLAYRSIIYVFSLLMGLLISICVTAISLWLLQVNINIYTLAGLTVSFGFILDNEIVILDYFGRFKNRSIITALLAGALTIVLSLCLIFFLPDFEKQVLLDFSIIIIISLVSSLLVAYYFTPALYSLLKLYAKNNGNLKEQRRIRYFFKSKSKVISGGYFSIIKFIARFRVVFVVLLIFGFGFPVILLPKELKGNNWYSNLYNSTLGSDYYLNELKPNSDIYLGGALGLFIRNVYHQSGTRSFEKTMLIVNASLPKGTSPLQLNLILSDYEQYLSTVKGLDRFITQINAGPKGQIQITFKDEKSNLPYYLKSALISRSTNWGGVTWGIIGIGQGFGNGFDDEQPNYKVILKGYNYDELGKQAQRLGAALGKNRRIENINPDLDLNTGRQGSEYFMDLDPSKMTLNKTNEFEIVKNILSLSKPEDAQISVDLDGEQYPVIIKDIDADQFNKYRLLNKGIYLDTTRLIQLKTVATIAKRTIANTIHKENRQYLRLIGFNYMGTVEAGSEYLTNTLADFKINLPLGYTAKKEVENNEDGDVIMRRLTLIIFLLLLIYLVSCMVFESLREPFYIMALIPLSFIGPFLVFSMGQYYFDQGGYASFFILGGLVTNSGILIINDYKRLKKIRSNFSFNSLLIRALSIRSKTVCLTIISSCCGLIPFILEGQKEVFWFSLGLGVVSGLVFSLIILFVILPVLLWDNKEKLPTLKP